MMKEKNIREMARRMNLVTVDDMCRYSIPQLVVMVANKVNELIDEVGQFENELIDEVGQFESDVVETLKSQNENIQYLLGEGLHLEVASVFDGWVKNGTFDTLINQTALRNVNNRIDETNTQLAQKIQKGQVSVTDINKNLGKLDQTYLTDDLLQQIAGSAPVNATPLDKSITTDKLANGSVNLISLSDEIKRDISDTEKVNVSFETNKYWDTQTGVAVKTHYESTYRSAEIEVLPYEEYTLTLVVGASAKQSGICLTDERYNIIWKFEHPTDVVTNLVEYKVTTTGNSRKLLLTSVEPSVNVHKTVYKNIASTDFVKESLSKIDEVNLNLEVGGLSADTGLETTRDNRLRTGFIHANSGCKITFNAKDTDGLDHYNYIICYYDFENKFIKIDERGFVQSDTLINEDSNIRIVIGSDSNKTLTLNDGERLVVKNSQSVFSMIDNINEKINVITKNENLKGKNLSIIGDSISTFKDWIPSGNKVYYTGSNSGVSSVEEMWWKRLANATGMNVLKVEAWSGSKVSNINAASEGFTPMSDLSRCNNLHDGDNEPDVIVIFAGTNDYSKSGASIGEYPTNRNLPTTNDTFSSAYALMLSRIQQRYPNAIIYCCSLPVFVRTNTDKTSIEWNSENKSIYDYNEVIRKISNLFSCNYIDLQGCGITRQNAYPTYCVDYENTPTHPNALGHELYFKQIYNEVSKLKI